MLDFCDICNITFKRKFYYDKHFVTKGHESRLLAHNKLLEKQQTKINLENSKEFKFDIKNKDDQIVGITTVDENVYHHLVNVGVVSMFSSSGYAEFYITIDGKCKKYSLHRYIYYIYLQNTPTKDTVIDHINNTRLDNRIENLREVTKSNNAINKIKSKNASSLYFGVSKRENNKFVCQLKYDNVRYWFSYDDELSAAYHYDLLIMEFGLHEFKKLNNVKKPTNFVLKEKFVKNTNLPKGVNIDKGRYYYSLHHKAYHGYDSADEAIEARNIHIEAEKIQKNKERLNQIIKKNINGIAILDVCDSKKIQYEIMVDDEDYHKLLKYSWVISNNYVQGNLNNKSVSMSRFIMDCEDSTKVVDHIDGNKQNYQKSNLRIISQSENNQNRLSAKNSSSKYIGVSYQPKHKKQWLAKIQLNGKIYLAKSYETEIEAVIARDTQARELNNSLGTFFKLNFEIGSE